MKLQLIPVIILFIPTVGISQLHRLGLLTDDYGIVTNQDLDEDEDDCEAQPFPEGVCMMYWQCLPTNDVKITCEDLGPDDKLDPSDTLGELDMAISLNATIFLG